MQSIHLLKDILHSAPQKASGSLRGSKNDGRNRCRLMKSAAARLS